MLEPTQPHCPECEATLEQPEAVDRRNFIRVIGERASALLALSGLTAGGTRLIAADEPKATTSTRPAKPAEDLVRELFATMTSDQKKDLVLAYDHGAGKGTPTRMKMYNAAIGKKIGDSYTAAQQELIERILRAISSDENGYRCITRNGTFDGSKSLQGCGANIFGDPTNGQPFAWVFTGHHITVRCDGNFADGAAFGGPMYYGHSPNGYSDKNVFNYQTKSVLSVFDVLSEEQRKKAIVNGSPGEQEPSIRLRAKGQSRPGIIGEDLTPAQRQLVEKVMRDVLSPFRKEDADEVMQIIRDNGGMEKIHLAFYQDKEMNDNERWHFWRLEGPNYVWNYRVLPHVHTYVNIANKV